MRLWHSHFGHLKYHVPRMPDHLGSDLDQFLTQRSQRPLLHRLGQHQTPQEVTKVVSQGEQWQDNPCRSVYRLSVSTCLWQNHRPQRPV